MARFDALCLSVLVVAATSCADPEQRRPQQAVEVRVIDYSGGPVEGAVLVAGDREIATTTREGVATIGLTGRDGDTVEVNVRCPQGYAAPSEALLLWTVSVDGGGIPSHVTRCRKVRHRLVVAVRADGGRNLPILRLGRPVGTTDGAGAANLMFDLDLGERVELTLSTESLAKEKVTPRDPTAVLDLGDTDDVKVFDVKFIRPKPVPKRVVTVRRTGPTAM